MNNVLRFLRNSNLDLNNLLLPHVASAFEFNAAAILGNPQPRSHEKVLMLQHLIDQIFEWDNIIIDPTNANAQIKFEGIDNGYGIPINVRGNINYEEEEVYGRKFLNHFKMSMRVEGKPSLTVLVGKDMGGEMIGIIENESTPPDVMTLSYDSPDFQQKLSFNLRSMIANSNIND